MKFNKLLKSKLVLYIIFFLSLVTIFGYLIKQNYPAILFFTLVLFLTKHFTSNMIVTLGISILATNLLNLFRIFSNKHLESMDNITQPSKNVKKILNQIVKIYFNDEVNKEDITNTITEIYKDHNKDNNNNLDFDKIDLKQIKLNKLAELSNIKEEMESIKSQMKNLNKPELKYLLNVSEFYNNFIKSYMKKNIDSDNKDLLQKYLNSLDSFISTINTDLANVDTKDPTLPSDSDTVTIASTLKSKDSDDKLLDSSTPSTAPLTTSATPPSTSSPTTCPVGFTLDSKGICVEKKEAMTSLNPAAVSSKESGSGNVNNIDNAKIKETAYDNLERIFSSDKVRSVANETNSLHERQNKIMDQLKDIGPLMQQAMSLIKNVDMDAINNVSSKMTGMIDKLQTIKTDIQ